jgi:hypothetical protein
MLASPIRSHTSLAISVNVRYSRVDIFEEYCLNGFVIKEQPDRRSTALVSSTTTSQPCRRYPVMVGRGASKQSICDIKRVALDDEGLVSYRSAATF